MKNIINYYYNIVSDSISKTTHYYKVNVNNELYILSECQIDDKNLRYIFEICKQLFSYGVYVHQIIPNNTGKLITTVENKKYVLMRVYIENNDFVTVDDLIRFNYYSQYINDESLGKREEWSSLWSEKIDYFEYQVNQFGKKYPIIRDSISYHIGLAESAIALLVISNVEKKLTIGLTHRRLKKRSTAFDFYNPLNLIIDNKVRDSSEYFKDCFLYNDDLLDDIILYFKKTDISNDEAIAFFARMMYPSYYFDLYESILGDILPEKKILDCIEIVDRYEEFLKKLYLSIKKMYGIDYIEWLIKT